MWLIVVHIRGQQCYLICADVGQVGRQHINWFGQGRDQVALQQAHTLLHAVTLAIEGRDGQRVAGDIDGVEIGQARLVDGEGDGNRAAARADIGHNGDMTRRDFLATHLQGDLEEQFGFRARDQHAPINYEIEAIKFFVTHKVGDGFASRAALDQRQVLLLLFGCEFAFGWMVVIC